MQCAFVGRIALIDQRTARQQLAHLLLIATLGDAVQRGGQRVPLGAGGSFFFFVNGIEAGFSGSRSSTAHRHRSSSPQALEEGGGARGDREAQEGSRDAYGEKSSPAKRLGKL